MKIRMSFQKSIVVLASLVACGYLYVSPASAQDNLRSQINAQFTGVIPGTSTGNAIGDPEVTGNPITDQSTRTGGFQANYGYQLNKWTGFDAGFGLARYSQNFAGDFGSLPVQSNLREIETEFLLHIPDHIARIHPYAAVGVGALRFMPTSNVNNAAGVLAQTRSSLVVGGGADFDISKRFGIRADYRALRFRVPDFRMTALDTEAETHISEPSVGVYFRFSKVSIGKKAHTGV